MWYHGVLPTMTIICASLVTPQIINYYLCKLVQNGNAYRRDLTDVHNLNLYWRDIRLTGSPYVMQGLSGIPDSDDGSGSGDGRGADGIQHQTETQVSTDPAYQTTVCPPTDM